MSIILFIFLSYIALSTEQTTSIIVLPFQTYKESTPLNISQVISNDVYTEIEIDGKILPSFFSLDEYGFYMTNKNCKFTSNYRILSSKSLGQYDSDLTLNNSGFISEVMYLYRDIELKNKFPGLFTKMYIESYNNETQCAIFGLKIKSSDYEYRQSFLKTFKQNGNIKYYKWTFKYLNDNEGAMVLGLDPSEYDSNTKYNIYSTNLPNYLYKVDYGLKFDYALINENKYLNFTGFVEFQFNLNAIFVKLNFYQYLQEIFFDNYINKNICKLNWIYQQYGYITCDSNLFTEKDMKNFPTIYLPQIAMNFTFELNYKDLFIKEKDLIYFLIMLKLDNQAQIVFGKPFLKKYTFSFDLDKITINLFVKEAEKNNESSILIWIVLGICLLVIVIMGGVFFYLWLKYFKNMKWKKRANELDDDYDYISDKKNMDENETNDENKLGV